MNEGTGAVATGAGALLRAARERQGLHIAALAAAMKVTPRKLEALEADRYDELPDATFARALALSVCRTLKIDPAPVLAQLPQARTRGLGPAGGGLNAPFRERPGRTDPAESSLLRHPLSWAAAALVLAAAVVLLLPGHWWDSLRATAGDSLAAAPTAPPASAAADAAAAPASAPDASAASATAGAIPVAVPAAAASVATIEVVHSAPAIDDAASASAAGPSGIAVLRAAEASWVEVVDAGGQVLVQRTLQPGENLGVDGRLPLKLKIGNAAGTQLTLRGEAVDLAPWTRDNVSRLELK